MHQPAAPVAMQKGPLAPPVELVGAHVADIVALEGGCHRTGSAGSQVKQDIASFLMVQERSSDRSDRSIRHFRAVIRGKPRRETGRPHAQWRCCSSCSFLCLEPDGRCRRTARPTTACERCSRATIHLFHRLSVLVRWALPSHTAPPEMNNKCRHVTTTLVSFRKSESTSAHIPLSLTRKVYLLNNYICSRFKIRNILKLFW